MKKIFLIVFIFIMLIFLIVMSSNLIMFFSTRNLIIPIDDVSKEVDNVECILILGAGIWGDKPSPMLEDRLLYGLQLYNMGISNKIIVSGEHTRENYDEVNVMKSYLIDKGVPSEDIFMDHAGISTYDSIYRAKEIFGINKLIVVTQNYHLYRSLYIGKSLNLECCGIASNPRDYAKQSYREIREILARSKDFIKCIFKPSSKYLGNSICVSGSGDITNDKI